MSSGLTAFEIFVLVPAYWCGHERLASGNPGDAKPVGKGVWELRINYGPGYRVYYTKQEQSVIILLAGGDKSTQSSDIKKALQLAQDL
jgi:putative addiction module killer protein